MKNISITSGQKKKIPPPVITKIPGQSLGGEIILGEPEPEAPPPIRQETQKKLEAIPKPQPVKVAPGLEAQKARIEQKRQEQYGRRKEAVILEYQEERLEAAKELAEKEDISLTEAKAKVGAPVSKAMVAKAKTERLEAERKEAVKKAEKILKPYKVEGGYNLAAALKGKKREGTEPAIPAISKATLQSLGFTSKQIKEAKSQEWAIRKIEEQARQRQQRFEAQNVKLPDGNWIDKEQLENIKKESPKMHYILTVRGCEPAMAACEKNQLSIDMLEGYKDKQCRVDGAKYLRDNPGDTSTLRNAGFTP